MGNAKSRHEQQHSEKNEARGDVDDEDVDTSENDDGSGGDVRFGPSEPVCAMDLQQAIPSSRGGATLESGDVGDTSRSQSPTSKAEVNVVTTSFNPHVPKTMATLSSILKYPSSSSPISPPIEMLGPSSFEFSPCASASSISQLYLSFISYDEQIKSLQMSASNDSSSYCRIDSYNDTALEQRIYILPIDPLLELYKTSRSCDNSSGHDSMTGKRNILASQLITPLIRHQESSNQNTYIADHQHQSSSSAPCTNRQREGRIATPSLQETLRRERQRSVSRQDGDANAITQFSWTQIDRPTDNTDGTNYSSATSSNGTSNNSLRIIVPLNGNIYVQDGVGSDCNRPLRNIYDKRKMAEDLYYTKARRRRNNNNTGNSDEHSDPAFPFISAEVERLVSEHDLSAIDPQHSPDGTMVAFVVAGEIYVVSCEEASDEFAHRHDNTNDPNDDGDEVGSGYPVEPQQQMPVRVTFGAVADGEPHLNEFYQGIDEDDVAMKHLRCGGSIPKKHLTNGVADYVAQEEMDRHTGFWWHPSSNGILFTRVDESMVPPYRIIHNARSSSLSSYTAPSPGDMKDDCDEAVYEEHRYPFAGKLNPSIQLGYVQIDTNSIESCNWKSREKAKRTSILNWSLVKWFNPPPQASEYLARVLWLPDGSACAHWQNRTQTLLEVIRIDIETGEQNRLLSERSNIWINLHDMFVSLPCPIHPNDCHPPPMIQRRRRNEDEDSNSTLPPDSFSFIYASERTNWCHLYLYTYIGGSREGAILLRTLSEGSWVVESIAGVDIERGELISR